MVSLVETPTRLVVTGTPDELRALREHFKFRPNGYFHADAYQLFKLTGGTQGWDGYRYPFQLKTATAGEILRGRKDEVVTFCHTKNFKLDASRCLQSPFPELLVRDIPDDLVQASFSLDENQKTAIVQWLRHGIGVINASVNAGKCLSSGTPIILFDGSTRPVESIAVGDLLMGPDSKPRRVLALGQGEGPLYTVEQLNGDDFTCNSDHILALQTSGLWSGGKFSTGDRIELSVAEFTELPARVRSQLKGYKAGIDFKPETVPVDPYFMGLWLGNGTSSCTAVTVRDGDAKVISHLAAMATSYGLNLVTYAGHGCATYRLSRDTWRNTGSCSVAPCAHKAKVRGMCQVHYDQALRSGAFVPRGKNRLLEQLRALRVLNNKHVPQIYLRNSLAIRWQLLSGLLDTDGFYGEHHVELTFSGKRLAEDVTWLMRSLGLRVSMNAKTTKCQTGAVGQAWRICAKGDFSPAHLLAVRRRPPPVPRRSSCYGIRVRPAGNGKWHGFTLDSDGLFLLGDFTVTHNTATYAGAAAYLKRHYPEARFLYFTFTERLVKQAYENLTQFLPGWHITQYGGGQRDNTGKDMVIATQAMLTRNFKQLTHQDWFTTFHALLCDESHHLASESAGKIMRACSAYFRLGASDSTKVGDPVKFNEIQGLCGPVRWTVTSSTLIEQGRSAAPHLYLVDVPAWKNKFKHLSHAPSPDSVAWTLRDGKWERATYLGPVYEMEDGEIKYEKRRVLVGEEMKTQKFPVIVSGLHDLRLADGTRVEADARATLLDRRYDQAIIRFKERNQLILEWAKYYSDQGWPTVVVATRTTHVLVLEGLLAPVLGDRVRSLTGEASTRERDAAFEWLKTVPGAVLISPLVKEGVSINAIKAGVVADVVADEEVARQIIGRFMRKKAENQCHLTWFLDQQCPKYFANMTELMGRLGEIEGFTFYWPVVGPGTLAGAEAHHGERVKKNGNKT